MKIGILYPRISHYREEFFEALIGRHDVDIFLYESMEKSKKENFKNSYISANYLNTYEVFKKIRLVNIIPILKNNYDVIILIGEIRSISVWILLIFYKFTKTKTILWGHGISMHSYLKESKKLNLFRVIFHRLANHTWLYTKNELTFWVRYISPSRLTALNNTINIEEILLNKQTYDKNLLKKRYGIKTEINLIFSARFTNPFRRVDLLLDLIKNLNPSKYGFIIIGDGSLKPNFKEFNNVYDFGAVYDRGLKNELFNIADFYFQPAWLGLSVNEALAYGKMVLTFDRSKSIKQCVEFSYLNNKNSFIAKDFPELVYFIEHIDAEKIKEYSSSARDYASQNLRMSRMIGNALNSLNFLSTKEGE
jgi:hypothetical protein